MTARSGFRSGSRARRASGIASTLAFVVLTASSVLTQEPAAPTPAAPAPAKPRGQPQRIDRVIATVNDAAIMESTLRAAIAGRRNAMLATGRPVTPDVERGLIAWALNEELQKHQLAQSAKTLGILPPERVEALLQDEIQRGVAERVRDVGSWQQFTDELQRTGSWRSYMRRERVQTLSNFARQIAVGLRMEKQDNLFLTPKMMRDVWRRQTTGEFAGNNRFVSPASAVIELVHFAGEDADKLANAARKLWTEKDMSAKDLLGALPGSTSSNSSAIEALTVTPAAREDLAAPEIADFALAGPEGAVSAPIPVADGTRMVARIRFYTPARNAEFSDPDVQRELRAICMDAIKAGFIRQALSRAQTRTQIWLAPELTR